ncbi:MAG: flavin reductase family protein [Pseudomonadales bacterium]|nr:flavin reductase family protein [Pseudomonadales bacterium]
MFFDPRENVRPAPLTHNPLNALIAPRPIGWICSLSATGQVNLAPFSYFNAVSADPPLVVFAPNEKTGGGPKDTLANVRSTGEFTASIVSESLARAMNETSREVDHGVNEFELAGLTSAPSRLVNAPFVAEARAALECEVWDIIALPSKPGGRGSHLVIGTVVGIHINDSLIKDGRIDTPALAPVARLGYFDYCVVRELFELKRPD